jgi:hypothetical protein
MAYLKTCSNIFLHGNTKITKRGFLFRITQSAGNCTQKTQSLEDLSHAPVFINNIGYLKHGCLQIYHVAIHSYVFRSENTIISRDRFSL